MIKAQNSITGKTNATIIKEFPPLENIEVTPSKETQNLKSEDFYGFNQVTVVGDENLDENNIISSKNIYGVQGTFDCDAKLDLASWNASPNKRYEDLYLVLTGINMTNSDLTGKTSLKGFFTGMSKLADAVIDLKGITDTTSLFEGCTALRDGHIKLFNTGDIEEAPYMFRDLKNLTHTLEIDTSSMKNITYIYRGCTNITVMKHMDFSSVSSGMNSIFADLPNLRTIESITGIGKGYTEKVANYYSYEVRSHDASYLDAASVGKIIDALADLNEVYDVANGGTLYTQKFYVGTAHKNKITAAQKQIVKNKGWTLVE